MLSSVRPWGRMVLLSPQRLQATLVTRFFAASMKGDSGRVKHGDCDSDCGRNAKGLASASGTALRNRKTGIMLVFGFAAGLPYTLLIGTLNAWLGEWEINLATIGVISWIGLAYAFKFLWSPLVDRVRLPVLERLGRAAQLADRLPGASDGDVLRAVGIRPSPAAWLVCACRGDRRLCFGDAGRRDRRVADRCRGRAGAGRNSLVDLPVRVSYRGADRRRARADPVGARQLAHRLRDHGRIHGADDHRNLLAPDTPRTAAEREESALRQAGAIEPKWRAIGLAIVGAGWLWAIWMVGSFMVRMLAVSPDDPSPPSVGDFTQTMGPLIVAATVILPAIVAAVFNWLKQRGEHVLTADLGPADAGGRAADHAYSALILPLSRTGAADRLGRDHRPRSDPHLPDHRQYLGLVCFPILSAGAEIHRRRSGVRIEDFRRLHDHGGHRDRRRSCSLPSGGCRPC